VRDRVTFFTVTDGRFFPGVAALVNSLRLQGHADDVVVGDLGLAPEQRARMAQGAEVRPVPPELGGVATLYKAFAPRGADGVVVVIDSDMVVTRPLHDVVASARAGRICLLVDETQPHRFFPEWSELFGLRAPLVEDRYLNAGFLALDTAHHPGLFDRWWQACSAIPAGSTRVDGAHWQSPTGDADQDALNALLMSEVPREVLDTRWTQQVADVLPRVRVEDVRSLRCALDGRPTTVLHHTGGPKPWQREAWMRVRANAYVRLLPRLLLADDVPVRLRPDELPLWLHDGPAGATALRLLDRQNAAVRAGGQALSFENRYVCKDGSFRWLRWNAAPDAARQGIYSVARDVTDSKRATEEREELVRELQTALEEVRTLRAILPICSYCRKVRDDENYWHTVESYVSQHTDTRFSHGICPDCMAAHGEPSPDSDYR